MNVKNMKSTKGNLVPNQFLIFSRDSIWFQSYDTLICRWRKYDSTLIMNKEYTLWSKTTNKYLAMFINTYTPFTYKNKANFQRTIQDSDQIEIRHLEMY